MQFPRTLGMAACSTPVHYLLQQNRLKRDASDSRSKGSIGSEDIAAQA